MLRVHEQRPVAKRTCCLPSSGEGGEDDQTKGVGIMGGRREETSMEKAGGNDRQDVGKIGVGAKCPVCGNRSKILKLTFQFPSHLPLRQQTKTVRSSSPACMCTSELT